MHRTGAARSCHLCTDATLPPCTTPRQAGPAAHCTRADRHGVGAQAEARTRRKAGSAARIFSRSNDCRPRMRSRSTRAWVHSMISQVLLMAWGEGGCGGVKENRGGQR